MTLRAPAILVVVLVVLALPAAAHGAPAPRDQDTRLLHDYNDDCGGDETAGLQQCRGTHDVIALDVYESRDATLGDVVVFRLLLNGAASSGVHEVVSFKNAGGAAKSFELATSDNQAFTVSGAVRASGPIPANDGARFFVDVTLRRDDLGAVGSKLSDYKVEAYKGTTLGDFMPGTYRTTLGTDGPAPTGQPTEYLRPEYALRGPSYYLAFEGSGTAQVPADGETIHALTLTNALRTTPQTVVVTATSPAGVQVRFHNPASGAYTDSYTVDLAKGATTSVHLALDGDAGATGTLMITATTDLGGRTGLAVPFEVLQPGSTPTETAPASSGPEENGAPAPTLPLLALALAAALVVQRRRS